MGFQCNAGRVPGKYANDISILARYFQISFPYPLTLHQELYGIDLTWLHIQMAKNQDI